MRLRGWVALLGLAACLLLAVACSDNDNDGGSSAQPTATATEARGDVDPEPDASEAAGGGASSMLNCGEEHRGQGGTGLDRAARECLWQAYQAGGGAVFTSTRPTVEGDPIVWHIELVSSDRIEVSIDSSADAFAAPASRRVFRYECKAMALTADARNNLAFEVTGCRDVNGEYREGDRLVI
jgi:hypothetical protein